MVRPRVMRARVPLLAVVLLAGWGCAEERAPTGAGPGTLERLELAPVEPLPPRELTLVQRLEPTPDLTPWVIEPAAEGEAYRALPVRKRAPGERPRDVPKRPGVILEGETGQAKRLTVPGPFDPARTNRVIVELIHHGGEPEPTRLAFLSEGKPVLRSPWLSIPSGLPPRPVVFDFPEARRVRGEIDAVAVETQGRVQISAILRIDLFHLPEHAFLPDPGAPAPVVVGGDPRSGLGLSSTHPLETEVLLGEDRELAFSYGLYEGLRLNGPDLSLVVTVTPEEGEPLVRRHSLPSRIRDEAAWQEARIPLAGAGRARVRFELESGGKLPAFVALAEVRAVQRGREAPTVLLITSDTHRADHVGRASEDAPVNTPVLDALADRGVFFQDATAATNVTNPSHVALMTGLTPRDTRILNNSTPLAREARTLAEGFRAGGYRTFASVSASHLLDDQSGLGQGFDRMSGPRIGERPGDWTLERLASWLDDAEGEPLFVWLHLFDAHAPYAPPKPFDRRYWEDGDPFDEERELDLPPIREIPGFLGKLRDKDFAYQQYRAEVDWVDSLLGEVLAVERFAEGVVAFTADHGECFGEHGIWWDHADLYPESIHVPLILAWPGGPRGVRVSEPVSQIDLGRTLLELAGLDAGGFPGRSLTWALERPEETEPRRRLSAHAFTASIDSGRWHLVLHLRKHHEWALEEGREAHQVEFYDRVADPDHTNDLVHEPEHFERIRRMRAELIEWLETAPAGLAGTGMISDEARATLEELGYSSEEEVDPDRPLYVEDPDDEWCRMFSR